MVLDITLFREDPDVVRDSQRRRNAPVEIVDTIIQLDQAWRKSTTTPLRVASHHITMQHKKTSLTHSTSTHHSFTN